MQEIQLKQVQRATVMFDALGIKYKLIAPDGQEFGTLEVKPAKDRHRAPLRYPYGDIAKWYKAQVNLSLGIGEVQTIPCGRFKMEDIRRGVCSYLSKEWGSDTYATHVTATAVEVMRTA